MMAEENLIDAVCHRLTFDKERLEKNELGRIEIESFNLPEFWTQFGAAVQALNNEVTKVGFACGKRPFPSNDEMTAMMQDLLQYYNIMRDLYTVFPPDVGAVLYKALTSAVVAVVTSLHDFVKSLHNLTEKGAQERLMLTGTFWDACKAVDNLPKDNTKATLNIIESEVDLASDAQEELETVNQEKIKPEKSKIGVDNVRKDPRDQTNPEKLMVSKKSFETVPENINVSQLNKENPRREKEKIEEIKLIENPKTNKSNQKAELIILTGTDFKNLEKWIEIQISNGKSPSSEAMQNEIRESAQLVQKLKTFPNDPFFANLNDSQKREKFGNLLNKLKDLLAMKKIVETETEKFKQMLAKAESNISLKESKVVKNKISENNLSQNRLNNQISNDVKLAVSSSKPSSGDKSNVDKTSHKVSGTNSPLIGSPLYQRAGKRPAQGNTNEKPYQKSPRTEMCPVNQTKINVQTSSSVRVPLRKEDQVKDINKAAQSRVSHVDTKKAEAIKEGIQRESTVLGHRVNSKRSLPSKAGNFKQSEQTFGERTQNYQNPKSISKQSPSVHNNIVTPTSNKNRYDELIHMVMPIPTASNCSISFLCYYPQLKITEALKNIASHNPGLNCTEWVVHREWWDEKQCYNALLSIDIDSFRELEKLGFTARVTYQYFAFFKRKGESFERLMSNVSQDTLPLQSEPTTSSDSFTPAIVSDYKHESVNISHSSSGPDISTHMFPVKVRDYQHGLPGCSSTDRQYCSDKNSTHNTLVKSNDEKPRRSARPREETLKEDTEGDEESWTESERVLAQNALGLAKVTHVCVRWLRDAVRKAGLTAPSHQLDTAASVATTISPALDDFVSELYHPVDVSKVHETAEHLVGVLRSLLAMVKESHFAAAFSLDNINKIEQFISHNHRKVDPNANPLPQLSSLTIDSTSDVTGHETRH